MELSYYMNPQERADPGESRYIRMIPPRLLEHDEDIGPAVSLQELKRQVQEQRRSMAAGCLEQSPGQSSEQSPEQSPEQAKQQKFVRHSRYGTGVVVNEDETMLEAEFEGYGKKEFIKAFSELEYI